MSVGTHHGKRRISPIEAARLIKKTFEAGSTIEQVAQFLGFKDPSMVSWFVKLLRVNETLHHLVGWGRSQGTVSFIAATELGGLNEDEQTEAFELVIANQLSKKEVFQAVQLRKRSKRRISECIAEVAQMRPTIIRKHVFLGAVLDESTRKFLATLKQPERDDYLAAALQAVYGKLAKTSGSLGVERFTIVTDDVGAAKLKSSGGTVFEPAINMQLAAKIPKL
jgi:hypothetical protein